MTVNSRDRAPARAGRRGALAAALLLAPRAAAASRSRRSAPSRVVAFGDETEPDRRHPRRRQRQQVQRQRDGLGDRPDARLPRQPDLGPERRGALRPGLPAVQSAADAVDRADEPDPRRRSARARPTWRRRSTPSRPTARSAAATWSRCWSARTTSSPSTSSTRRRARSQLIANVEAEGAEVGRQVNRLADLGAKVLLATVARRRRHAVRDRTSAAAHTDTDRAALLTRLTAALQRRRCAGRSSTTAARSA